MMAERHRMLKRVTLHEHPREFLIGLSSTIISKIHRILRNEHYSYTRHYLLGINFVKSTSLVQRILLGR